MTAGRALVLGGGGLAGIAWHTGMVYGMAEAGVDVTTADFIVGTSAGATVAAQIGSGQPVEDWYRRQVELDLQTEELRPAGMPIERLWEMMLRLVEEFPDPGERRRQTGTLARETNTVPEAVRRAIIADRLRGLEWPTGRMAIVAVDASTGQRRVFDAHSGVDLVDAVAASCAVPGIWPPVTIDGSRYIDGGVYSSSNADLAAGQARVLVLAPMATPELAVEVELINRTGQSGVLSPDAHSVAAFGIDPLDPAVRAPSARAGYTQGGQVAAAAADLWAP